MSYLMRFLNASDPTASLKHAAYALVVVASVIWLSWDLTRGPIDSNWCVAFGLLLAAVTTGKIVGVEAPAAPEGPGPGRGQSC